MKLQCFPKLRRRSKGKEVEEPFQLDYFKVQRRQEVEDALPLSCLPNEDKFRNVYVWLESQDGPYSPCACCRDSLDCHYACVDVTRRLITFSPARPFSQDVNHSRSASYLSQHSSPRTSLGTSPDTARTSHYSNPDLRTPIPPTRTYSRSYSGNHHQPPTNVSHSRSNSYLSENTEYIYLDFDRSPRTPTAEESWHVTRKPVRSPVRSAFV